VPAAQLEHLGVLRRPATAADHGAEVRGVLRLIGPGFRGVRTDAVRLLEPGDPGNAAAGAQVLIPARRAQGIDDALCLYVVDPTDGAGGSCFTLNRILAGTATMAMAKPVPMTGAQRRRFVAAMGAARRKNRDARRAVRRALEPLPKDARARRRLLDDAYSARGLNGLQVDAVPPRYSETDYVGLVPDGVARVTRTDGDGTHSAPVDGNVFRIRVPRGDPQPGRITWLDPDGRAIRTIAKG
jgi:hypothetical protein